MAERIFLIGFMGTGKTTVGESLARELQLPLFDIDHEIVKREGRTIPEIFATNGEAYFRRVESEVLLELSESAHAVITTGGGAVLAPGNRELMGKSGFVVCLAATVEEIVSRVSGDPNRPLLQSDDLRQRVIQLQEARAGLYDFAHVTLDTTGRSVDGIVGEIIMKLSAS
ncbi:shikimate kinase [Tumebacillus sp. ITR2]|uniref:Shikimate kinase n=1 Tax=Tumebacillus amylolyticus TaxID=2801339 RepID=A0ABS1J9T0_9BACL|nr:shikimate kinase [Tumebacillus amylolyticus]MBL0387027.1 shikimate kinase [Tumebacillus amylolyticus]